MKRVLAFALALPLAAALGVLGYSWWRERSFEADHPPPGHFYGGLHAIDRLGAEPSVVFIHGNPGTCLDFSAVMDRLSPKVRTFAFDRPGYGWSRRSAPLMSPADQARELHDAVRQLGLVRPVLAGFSFGGPVALAYALDYPSDVSALVLIAAVGSPAEKHVMSPAQAKLLEPTGPLVAWSLGPILGPAAVADGYADAFFPRPVDPEVVDRGRYHFTRPVALLAAARDWHVLETELPKLAARYSELKVPVELLSANQDRIVGPAHAAYLAEHVPGAHRVDVDQAGHQLMSTHPEQVVEAVMRAVVRSRN